MDLLGLQQEPLRDTGPEPQDPARHRQLQAESVEPRPQGARARAGDVPARRAVPGDRARPRAHRARHRQPLRTGAGAPVRATRPVPPLLFLPRVRAARPLQHAGPRAHREARARGLRRRRHRIAGDAVRVRARAPAHAGAHAARRRAGRRRGRARTPHHGYGAHLAGPAQGRAARRPRRGRGAPTQPRLERRLPGCLPGRHAVRHRGRRHRDSSSGWRPRPGELPMGLYRRADQPPHKVQFKILAQGPAHPDLRRPADDREPRAEADQRASLRHRQRTGRLLDPGLRARASARRAHRPRDRRTPLHDHVRARLVGRRRQRRLQPPGPRGRPRLARSHGAADVCALVRAARACRSRRPTWRRRSRATPPPRGTC